MRRGSFLNLQLHGSVPVCDVTSSVLESVRGLCWIALQLFIPAVHFFFFFKILSERLFVSVWRRRCCTKFCDLIRHHHCRCWDTGGVLTVYGSCAPLSEGHRAGVEAQLVRSVSVSAGLCVTVIRNLPCSWLDLERLRCERGLLP